MNSRASTRVAVLVSGSGTNLQAIIDELAAGKLPLEIIAVISDRPDAYGLERARAAGIDALAIDYQAFATRADYDAELEATLVAMEGITDAAVIGLPDDDAGELPIAFVVRVGDAPDEAAIKAHFTECLSTYKQVHQIRFVDAVPKSASGKILRRLLRDQVLAE